MNVNGTRFFSADDGTGRELWRTDGTASGTTQVADINPSGSSSPARLTNVGGTLFFQADDGSRGTELWRSDGTASGTTLVKDIYPGSSSDPGFLTNVNGALFFVANDGVHGVELWGLDPAAPVAARLRAPDVTSASAAARYDFTVTFRDNLAIDAATLGNSDVRVTGPNGFSQLARLVRVSPGWGGAALTATYRITPPGGTWDTADDGTYTITLLAGEVADTFGNVVPAGVLGGFVVDRGAVPPPVRFSLSGFRFNRATGRQHQVLTITNAGDATLLGGFALILSNLPPGVTLQRALLKRGDTSTALAISTSNGRTQVSLPASLVPRLRPGAALTLDLAFANATPLLIGYDLRFLADTED